MKYESRVHGFDIMYLKYTNFPLENEQCELLHETCSVHLISIVLRPCFTRALDAVTPRTVIDWCDVFTTDDHCVTVLLLIVSADDWSCHCNESIALLLYYYCNSSLLKYGLSGKFYFVFVFDSYTILFS